REFDQLVNEFFPGYQNTAGPGSWATPWDVVETNEAFELMIDLPGIMPEDVQVEFNDGVLTVSGERKVVEAVEGRKVHRSERRAGPFSRSVKLPEVDGERISAQFKHGVLTVVAPKIPAVTPRKIEVKVS
ncbi:MAG: Hsp20/alpha crystallin family protein, partial [Planctomycetota bacterium]